MTKKERLAVACLLIALALAIGGIWWWALWGMTVEVGTAVMFTVIAVIVVGGVAAETDR